MVLVVVAIARPQTGAREETSSTHGVDIVVALDVSDSMLVEDAETGGELSRLERAKREIADLLRLLEGDRIGLVAFAGAAFSLSAYSPVPVAVTSSHTASSVPVSMSR